MSSSHQNPYSVGQILTDGHAARVLATEIRHCRQAVEAATASSPSAAALLNYARRKPGDVTDFAMEVALRRNSVVMNRYRNVLRGLSLAHSPVALAAATAKAATMLRRVGAYELSVTYDNDDASSMMIIYRRTDEPWPTSIEVHQADHVVRLSLPPPVGAQILIVLDPGIPMTALLLRLLSESDCQIYLI